MVAKTSVRPGESLMAKDPKGRGATVEIVFADGATLRAAAELLAWLAHGGEGDRGGGGELDVVVADDRELLGHPDPGADRLLEKA